VTSTATLTVSPAELPLPGGSEGATLTLRPLLTAVLSSPPGWFERVDGPLAGLKAFGFGVRASDRVEVPVVAFLLEHPSAGLVLVDTGLHGSVAAGSREDRSRNLGPIGRLMVRGMSMSPEQSVAAQLAALGIDAADIRVIVMTHLHFDHASALCDFPGATALVSTAEWSAATGGGALNGYVAAQFDPRVNYRTIDFGAPPAREYGPFEATVDLFGDGSLTLVFTPGHSRGHVALLARLSDRDALIAGDAVYTLATLREGKRPWRSDDADAFERSVAQLAVWDRENAGALVIPGHDMPAWRTLDSFYG
jgi:glyoxylase-like metal-dependent hydrolase (beta-lactamase superfamily II)